MIEQLRNNTFYMEIDTSLVSEKDNGTQYISVTLLDQEYPATRQNNLYFFQVTILYTETDHKHQEEIIHPTNEVE